jgi:PAS domain S-box-containing protein
MMSWQYPPYELLLVLAGIVSTALAFGAWRRRPLAGTAVFALLMLAVAKWSLTYALSLMSTTLPLALFWDRAVYLGTVAIGPVWLVFALQYTGRERWLRHRNIALLAIIPLVTLALVWTNEAHGLIYTWTGFEAVGSFLVLNASYGPWFWVHIVYTYALLMIGTILLFQTLLGPSTPRLYRGQSVVVLIGVLAPWVASALDLAELGPFSSPIDLAPFACTLTGVTVTWGLFGFRFLDIIPVVHDAVIDGISDGMIVLDLRGRVIDLNPAAQDLIGAPTVQAIGQQVGRILSFWSEISEHSQEATETQAEIIWNRDGKQVHYDLRVSPLTDRRGRLTGQLILLHNITQRVQAEAQIRQLKEFNEDIVQNMAEGIVLENAEGSFTFVNPAVAVPLGYLPEEMTGLHWTDIIPPDQHPIVEAADQRRMRGESDRYELELVRKDGQRISVLVGGSPRFEKGRFVGTLAVFADITERKRTEGALRKSEEKWRLLYENLPGGSFVVNRDYIIEDVNDVLCALTGFAREELVGQLCSVICPKGPHQCPIFDLGKTRIDNDETSVRTKDGGFVPIIKSAVRFPIAGQEIIVENFQDITERKRAEEELEKHRDRLEELVRERTAELMAAKDVAEEAQRQAEAADRAKSAFLASMSHELRTPLNAILGYAQILQRRPLAPEAVDSLDTIQQSGEHLLILIDDILTISKIETGRMELHPTPIWVSSFLDYIAGIVGARAEAKGLAFRLEELNPLPTSVQADEIRLRQVLLNLLDNAVKFTEKGQVTLRVKQMDKWANEQMSEFADLQILRFEVADTGSGIPLTHLERIFQPFEQAEDVSRWTKGAGLGLAISRQWVHLMGGELQVESEPGQGSTFWFEVALPVREVAAEAVPFPEPVITSYRGLRRAELVPPPKGELAILLDLARRGDMRGIRERATHIERMGEQYLPFASNLRELAQGFEERRILALVVQYMDEG